MKEKKRVLFICTHNSARSQMAEGLMNAFYGDRYIAYSAGTYPAAVNPYTTRVMDEIDIDISKQRAKNVAEYSGEKFDYVVTVCDKAKEECAYFPGAKKYLHASFDNPSEFSGSEKQILAGFRRVRDEIREWIKKNFVSEH
ncbi:MAG: arsenate reductase ArsC [Candidatus Altiarchaeia archaeon]|jgi:arsenate reductase